MGFPNPQTKHLHGGWRFSRSPVLAVLIGATVAVFVFQALCEVARLPFMTEWFALSMEGIRQGYLWQFVTYMFMHSVNNPLHIVANMMMLYFAGREVETIVGPRHLLGIYFIGGIVGGALQMALDGSHGLIGASAGTMAVLIAFTTAAPELELTMLLFFVIPVRMKAKYLGWGLVIFSALAPMLGIFQGWGHLAHLGGCLTGWIFMKQLGFGNPLRIQRYFIEKRARDERLNRMPPEQYISEEIDPLLDKIAAHGIHSLTRAERRTLERGRDKIAKRTTTSVH